MTAESPSFPDTAVPRRVWATRVSWSIVGFYCILIGILLYVARSGGGGTAPPLAVVFLVLVLVVFLARYLSTHYALDDRSIAARRLFGSRRLMLETVRRIEYANLRDLGPVSFLGGWGWRGRMWSPVVG